jgi:hypothetical protein
MEHLDPGPGERLNRWIIQGAKGLHEASIEAESDYVAGDPGKLGNEEADHPANVAREDCSEGILPQRVYTPVANRTWTISETNTPVKGEWVADICSNHSGYRLKGNACNKRLG